MSIYSWLKKSVRAIAEVGKGGTRNVWNFPRFGQIPAATINRLLGEYKRTIYSCINLNGDACASIELKLFVITRKGEKKPRVKTVQISDFRKELLLQKRKLQSTTDIEEVVQHPVLDLLEKANDSNFLNGQTLKHLTFKYKDLLGRSYWWIDFNPFLGIPRGLWLIPTQYISPKKESNSQNIVDYYEFRVGTQTTKYSPDEIIQYLHTDFQNPYLDGVPPAAAAFDDVEVYNRLVALEAGLLANEARFDYMLSPKSSEDSWGAAESERMEKQLIRKYGNGRGGGPFVTEEPVEISILQFPPRDLARLEISKESKNIICNCFGVPIALINSEKQNKMGLEAALTQHAIFGVRPRLDADAAVKNDRLIPLYDDSGRLFFEYENCVPQDKAVYLQETVQLKMNGIITPNEGRKRHKYKPVPGGDKLETANTANNTNSPTKRNNSRKSGSAKK